MGKRVLLAGYYLAFGLFLIAAALSRPQFNWDIIPYLGATESFEIQDKQALHASVFDELARFVPASAYQSLVTGSDYRVAVATDPEAFSQQLPFYQPRVLYIGLLFLLSKLGLNVVMVTYLISAVSVALGLWVLFVAFHRTLSGYLLLLFPVLALGMGVLDLARLSTADGLAFLAIALVVYLFLKGHWALFIVLPLSVLVRTDLILFVSLVLATLFISRKSWRWPAVGAFLASMGTVFYLNRVYGNYGWPTLFYHSFIEKLARPAEAHVAFTLRDYLSALLGRVKGVVLNNKPLPIYVGLAFLTGYLALKGHDSRSDADGTRNDILALLVISFVYVVLHLLLHPVIADRYFVGPYMVGILALLYFLSPARWPLERRTAAVPDRGSGPGGASVK